MKKRLLTVLLYIACGALCALPAVIEEAWILGWVGFVPVLVCEYLRDRDEKHPYLKAWWRGFSFIYAYGLVTFYWFIELYPLDFAGFTPLAALGVVLIAWLGIPLLQCISGSFIVVMLTFFARKKAPLPIYPLIAAATWTACEWTHTLTWAGVPWGKLAVGQTGQLTNVQSASLFGSYFVSFIMIFVAGLIALSVVYMGRRETLRRAVASFLCAIAIFEANSIYGIIAMNTDNPSENTVCAAAIQANIASDEKWSGATSYDTYAQLTRDAASEGAELIVWPETALPYKLNEDEWLYNFISDLSKETDTGIIVGCFREEGEDLYNATQFVSPEGYLDSFYSKRRLVPFGEFVPLRGLIMTIFPPLAEVSMLSRDLAAGEDAAVFETEFGKIGSLICFDSIYETLALTSVRDGAQLLCISTNDSWFHDSSAVYEHNAHAKLRSIENGRYTVRAANTGISSIITDKGEAIDTYPPLVQGFAVGEVEFMSHRTLYSYVGNLIVYLSFAILAIFVGINIVRNIKNGYSHR